MTTTTDIKITTQTATVAASEFMRAVLNAVLSASADDTLPMICAVRFRPGHTPGTLMLEATNRYQASQEEIDLADLATYDSDWSKADVVKHLADEHGIEAPVGYDMRSAEQVDAEHRIQHDDPTSAHDHSIRPVPVTELDVLVNAKDLAKLVRTLKLIIEPETKHTFGPEAPHVVITHTPVDDGYSGKVSFTLINNNGTETTVSPKAVYGEFVKIDVLMDSTEKDAAESVTTTGSFNPAYLAVYTKVDTGERTDSVDLAFTGYGKPTLIKVGQRYRGLIIPIRKAG